MSYEKNYKGYGSTKKYYNSKNAKKLLAALLDSDDYAKEITITITIDMNELRKEVKKE